MITRDLRQAAPRDIYRILTSLVIPRPIAWISTLNQDGTVNLAPFSAFMGIFNPPMVAVNFAHRKDGTLKDTQRNLRDRGEAVVHLPDAPLLEAMHACGEDLPEGESELLRLGLATLPSQLVGPPILAQAPVALECRFNREIGLSQESTLVLLDVLMAHARDGIWNEAYDCADADLWEPVGRLASVAGPNYAGLGERLTLGPPKLPGAKESA
jgi:flavin reductase (DIM6/NTAB) family NADH-FMN oxidoreductase RutF